MTTEPPSPAPLAGAPFDALPSPLEAVPELRAAARWTIAAFGAVGAALIGGGPLVAVGRIHGIVDALIAGAALVVALGGVSVAIWRVSQVLTPPLTTPATLSAPETRELREMVDAAPADFFGALATGVDDLLRHRLIAVSIDRAMGSEADAQRREQLRCHRERVQANIVRTDPYVRWLLALAHVWQIRAAMNSARRWCLLALVLVVIGAVGFLVVTAAPT